MPLLSNLRRLFICAVVGVSATSAHAATFYADLDLAPTSGEFGPYLTSTFDFGVSFRSIETSPGVIMIFSCTSSPGTTSTRMG